ncbi:MAG: protein translocase subunit SecD [Anaerolineales bacterium]|jgi:preprotein translocase subunit SecD
MIRNVYTRLIIILVILGLALWIDLNDSIVIYNPFNNTPMVDRNVKPRLGLDLQGGLQVLLEADVPATTPVDAESMQIARTIMENRTNALGVSENVLQVAGERRIVGEFPGLENTDQVLATIQQTGLLEFVDTGDTSLAEGTEIQTDFATGSSTDTPAPTETPAATETPTAAETPVAGETPAPAVGENPPTVYHTIMTGKDLKQVSVSQDRLGQYLIQFELTPEGAKIFADFTAAHIDQYLTLVLDKKVISSPVIKSAIPDGQGVIQGNFTAESANALAVQLRYGSLPVPLKVVETRIIGPTLGEDSLQKSVRAGLIGMVIVILFMGIYYRLPGITADISILMYAGIVFAIFKYIGVTLTLPGIAGFMLSTGSALDANILVFERLKEELRGGKSLRQAFDQAWTRAWPSIRDSNIAALITSAILFWFGSTFGATIVKGFSLTLAMGVIISLFSALYITRTLLALALDWFKPQNLSRWIGI